MSEKKTGAKPILIGGDFTPTWHVVGCPCDDCVETRNTLAKLVIMPNKIRKRKLIDDRTRILRKNHQR